MNACTLLTARQGEDVPRIKTPAKEIPKLQETSQEGELLTAMIVLDVPSRRRWQSVFMDGKER